MFRRLLLLLLLLLLPIPVLAATWSTLQSLSKGAGVQGRLYRNSSWIATSGGGYLQIESVHLTGSYTLGSYSGGGSLLSSTSVPWSVSVGNWVRVIDNGSVWSVQKSTDYVPPSCSDGIQNQDETGVDCGGVCSPCATCTDGVQNQGETGVDCGGPCDPCIPAHCSDGTMNLGEAGIDCGGGGCPYECVNWCPEGFTAAANVICEYYRDQDAMGNCPPAPAVSGLPILWTRTDDGRCRYTTPGALGKSDGEGGVSPPYPEATLPGEYQGGTSASTSSTEYTYDGTSSTAATTFEHGGGASGTWSETVTTDQDGKILSSETTGELEVPPESNWSNYDFSKDPSDNNADALGDPTIWGERPDWSTSFQDLDLGDALTESEVQLVNPSPVLIDTNVPLRNRSMHLFVTLAPFESIFAAMGSLFVAMAYIWGVLLLCKADRGGD